MFATDINSAIIDLIAQTDASGGGTVSVTGHKVPDTGYMVGGYVESLIAPAYILDDEHVSYEMIYRFVSTNFTLATKFSMFVGAWIDVSTEKLYIDLSQHFDSLSEAMAVAAFHGEIAIWDLAESKEIIVK